MHSMAHTSMETTHNTLEEARRAEIAQELRDKLLNCLRVFMRTSGDLDTSCGIVLRWYCLPCASQHHWPHCANKRVISTLGPAA